MNVSVMTGRFGIAPRMVSQRENPYIWTTAISRLLAGENSCEWAAWFKAHYQNHEKAPSDFDLPAWQMAHAAALNDLQPQLENKGYGILREGQNKFALRGRTITLGGQPDFVALGNGESVIYEVKTGNRRASDQVQAMIYMYALPHAWRDYRSTSFAGCVAYPDGEIRIPASAIDEKFKSRLFSLLARLAASEPARKVPSSDECRFCEIARTHCPERVDGPNRGLAETSDF
jgi:hypothetical protein